MDTPGGSASKVEPLKTPGGSASKGEPLDRSHFCVRGAPQRREQTDGHGGRQTDTAETSGQSAWSAVPSPE